MGFKVQKLHMAYERCHSGGLCVDLATCTVHQRAPTCPHTGIFALHLHRWSGLHGWESNLNPWAQQYNALATAACTSNH